MILLDLKRNVVIVVRLSTKDEIICDFADMIDQIGQKPSDEIESGLQKIIYRIRPYVHKVT